jgi:hypothetical protein
VLTLALLSCLAGCVQGVPNIHPQEANVVSLDPQNWYIFYSSQISLHPSSSEANGAWSFYLPPRGGYVGYVQTPFNATTTLHNVIVSFTVESNAPQYEVLDPSDIPPATVHLFFEQQGDDLRNPDGRWWADFGGYNLGSQDNTAVTLVVPLTPDQWTNVYGANDPQAFYASLGNAGWMGLTFGGQYFWGHGVALSSGSAKFVLLNFKVN